MENVPGEIGESWSTGYCFFKTIKAEQKTPSSNRCTESERESGTLSLELTAHVLQANCEGGFTPQMPAIVQWKITICR